MTNKLVSNGFNQAAANFYFTYDEATGYLINRFDRGPRAIAGERAGHKRSNGYRVVGVNFCGKQILMREHRIIWLMMTGDWPENDVDHINGVRDDNRWINLRAATRSENLANKRQYGKSGYKGVSNSGNIYIAKVGYEGRQYYLGCYKTPEEAHEMYCRVAKALFGEFHNAG